MNEKDKGPVMQAPSQ